MVILVDTREQLPYDFSFYPEITTQSIKLDTGDYTIEGKENIVTIDRKMTCAEVAHNVGADKVRFEKELERMSKIKYAYLLCEFSIDDVLKYPKNSDVPLKRQKYIKIKGKFILKTLYEYRDGYGVIVEFCGNREKAEERIVEIFKHVEMVT